MRLFAALALACGLFVSTAAAQTGEKFDSRQFTCPVGGKTFTHDTGYSAFPLITMPDGSWLGDTEIGVQIPVCPDNGLVLLPELTKSDESRIEYAEYSAAERARLPALIADPEYVALKADGPYAQAYWLATKLGRPGEDRFFMLQRSTWATRDPTTRKRLVARLAVDGEAVIATYKSPERTKRFHLVYVASALRELGRFDEAAALLDKIERSGPPVLQPQNPDSMFGPDPFAPQLRQAIADKDDGRFPAAMLPRRMFNDICDEKLKLIYGPTGVATKNACKAKREREARETAESEAANAEQDGLRRDPVALDKKCAATPEGERGRGLQMACEFQQSERDRAGGDLLARDGEKLAAQCEATPEAGLKGPLLYGCISYRVSLESALQRQLADDELAYAIICPDDRDVAILPDRSSSANLACSGAFRVRTDRATEKLLADPVALDARCKATNDGEDLQGKDHLPLFSACYRRKLDREGAGEPVSKSRNRNVPMVVPPPVVLGPAEAAGDGAAAAATAVAASVDNDVIDKFDERSSLSKSANARAAAIIAKAKTDKTYPKRLSGEAE